MINTIEIFSKRFFLAYASEAENQFQRIQRLNQQPTAAGSSASAESWAYKHYHNMQANDWSLEDIPIEIDNAHWKDEMVLTDPERRMLIIVLTYYVASCLLIKDNIASALANTIESSEVKLPLEKQASEIERNGNYILHYLIHAFNVDRQQFSSFLHNTDSIRKNIDFFARYSIKLRNHIHEATEPGSEHLLINIFLFGQCLQGILNRTCSTLVLDLCQHDKLPSLKKIFEHISSNEKQHIDFFQNLFYESKAQTENIDESSLLGKISAFIACTSSFTKELIVQVLKPGNLEVNITSFQDFVDFISDEQLEQLGLPKQRRLKENPLNKT